MLAKTQFLPENFQKVFFAEVIVLRSDFFRTNARNDIHRTY
jgi:hypothetical protein